MANSGAVLLSEWTKVRTVRSTVITLAITFVVTVGLGAGISALTNSQWHTMSPTDRATFDATSTSFSGILLGQLALIVFAVLVVGNEYSTGMIRTTLSAVPRRWTLLLSKAAVVLALVLPVALVTSFTAFFIGQALLGSHSTSLGAPHVLRAVLAMAVYMTLLAELSLGVAFMLRKPVASLGLLMPFFFLISPILGNVPKVKTVARYFPDRAGQQMVQVVAGTNSPYGPVEGFFVCLAWVAVCLAGGYLLLRQRDA
ncbi:ABC transporter permease [Streptacidiphilus sp. PB12-B1b]|uniref:ABC transporter permease n=1 Tax=Streptacidiphilus sp. PB12-B1b TaxID=2705012 RepID=UPI0015F8B221|nr:ABC transporter permease [Streptacidiphilus sp. PB12-B1b]QMU79137.1 ABC transporter permease [Streptacidiphilus sp. PB12-B1b]